MRRFTTPEVDRILDDWDAQFQPDPFLDLEGDVEPGAEFSWDYVRNFKRPIQSMPLFSGTNSSGSSYPPYPWLSSASGAVPASHYTWTSRDQSLVDVLGGVIEDGRVYFPSPPPEESLASGDGQGSGDSAQEPLVQRGRGLVEELGGWVIDGTFYFPPDVLGGG